MRLLKAVFVVGLASLVFVSVAVAQRTYLGNAGEVQNEVGGQQAGTVAGSLPFTGFDLGALFIGGLLLLILGFGLRRHARHGSTS